jgi:hypothetical protein
MLDMFRKYHAGQEEKGKTTKAQVIQRSEGSVHPRLYISYRKCMFANKTTSF